MYVRLVTHVYVTRVVGLVLFLVSDVEPTVEYRER